VLTPEQVRAIVNDAIAQGVGLHWTVFVFAGLLIIAAIARPLVDAYMAAKGKTLATKQDLREVLDQVRQTTRATHEIQAAITNQAWIDQKRWDLKLQCYRDIAEQLAHAGAILGESVLVGTPPNDAELTAAIAAMNRAATSARIAVPGNVRTLLSRIADDWHAAASVKARYNVVFDGWISVLDAARVDLFGEQSELSPKGST